MFIEICTHLIRDIQYVGISVMKTVYLFIYLFIYDVIIYLFIFIYLFIYYFYLFIYLLRVHHRDNLPGPIHLLTLNMHSRSLHLKEIQVHCPYL